MPITRPSIADRTAIAGVGSTAFTKRSNRSVLSLATEASLAAISDAGLTPEDIDGVVSYYWADRDTAWPHELVRSLGVRECHHQVFCSLGGGWACAAVANAAMAIHAGLCRAVLVYRAANSRSQPTMFGGEESGPFQWIRPIGAGHPANAYGAQVTAHMAQFGTTSEDMGRLAVLQRQHASLNTKAMMRTPLTLEEHQASDWVVYPFRLFDCCLVSDGAVALVVTSTDQAVACSPAPVAIAAMAGGTMTDFSHATTIGAQDPWAVNAPRAAARLYETGGFGPEEIDLAELYDPFTGMCLLHIEGFGLTDPGQSAAFVAGGGAGLDGSLPINTHGGMLSEAATAGLGHVVEAVQQLRPTGVNDDLCSGAHSYDRAECRQVRDARRALVCGESGDSALLLRRL
jgi:acetyl-CoA acetyltransferase